MENEIESGEHETKEEDFLRFALICVPSDSNFPIFKSSVFVIWWYLLNIIKEV